MFPCLLPSLLFSAPNLSSGWIVNWRFLISEKKRKKTKKRNRASREISWKNDVLIFVRYLFKYIGGGFPQFTPSAQRTYKGWAAVAEWLRRLTRNQIPSGSVGSNPTGCEGYFFLPIPAARDSKSVYFYVKSTSTNCPIDKHFVYRFIRCPRFALLGANFTCWERQTFKIDVSLLDALHSRET